MPILWLVWENVKCVYDIIGAGLQTCLYQMAVIFIPFTMVYFFKGCYRYGIIIRQTQLKQVWLKMCVKLTKIILAVSVYLTVLICLIPFCFTDVIWNWSAQTSYVYIYGGVDTVYHPSVILVAAGCFTAVFTALMIVCFLVNPLLGIPFSVAALVARRPDRARASPRFWLYLFKPIYTD